MYVYVYFLFSFSGFFFVACFFLQILLVGSFTCKNRLPYNLCCVGGDVKHCSVQSNPNHTAAFMYFSLMSATVVVCCPADVLSEDAILKWYSDGKGKGVLLEQLKPFVEWLKQAEEGGDSDLFSRIFILSFSVVD